MTVIRLSNGNLVVHSPTRLDIASQEEFQKLGPIVAIIAPSWWHDLYLREYLSAYPDARLYGAPTLVRWNRSLPFAEVLGDLAPSLWRDEIDQVHVQGIGLFLDEIVSLINTIASMVCHAHRMGRKEAYNFLKQFVLEQMHVPDWPYYPMNDLRKMTPPPLPPTSGG